MNISILLLLITFDCIYSLDEPINIELDVETVFDYEYNNEFLLYYDNDIYPLIMKINPENNEPFNIYGKYPGFYCDINGKEEYYVSFTPAIGSYYYRINSGKGTFIMHCLNTTIKIDFTRQCYGSKQYLNMGEYNGSLIYFVSNLNEDKIVNFSYKNKDYNPNPFKVCHGNECITDLSEYKFEKGEEYTIEVKIRESCYLEQCHNFIDSFSFCSQDSKDENNTINSSHNLKINLIILLFLLLIIFYH